MSHSSIERFTGWEKSPSLLLCTAVCIPILCSALSKMLFSRSLADAALCRLSEKLIVSFVYSHDVVSRLSLGTVRDLKNAAMWLCEAEAAGKGEGWSAITTRAGQWKSGVGSQDDKQWVIFYPSILTTESDVLICFSVHRDAKNFGSQHAKP